CNGNGVPDYLDIFYGLSTDCNGNGVPDECEPCTGCTGGNYCQISPNSVGSGALISYTGSASIANDDLILLASYCPSSQYGIFFYGPNQSNIPYGDGNLCVGGQIQRLPIVNTGPSGVGAHPLDYTNPPQPSGQITAGSTWNFQFWYRDPTFGTAGFNFSDGLEVTFCP
ncbi:MAG: hypothetical protein QF411_07185, partial [Planctomycetota bacterium]|nr:hypothetical protein [Planctomycetota bacterium]